LLFFSARGGDAYLLMRICIYACVTRGIYISSALLGPFRPMTDERTIYMHPKTVVISGGQIIIIRGVVKFFFTHSTAPNGVLLTRNDLSRSLPKDARSRPYIIYCIIVCQFVLRFTRNVLTHTHIIGKYNNVWLDVYNII